MVLSNSDNGEWSCTFGGSVIMTASYVDITSDGGYILTGWEWKNASTVGDDLWVIKTNEYGEMVWHKIFGAGGSRRDAGYCAHQTSDGGYIVVGFSEFHDPDGDVWLIKLDGNGNIVWNHLFGGKWEDIGYSVQQTSDGGYIIVGETMSYGNGSEDVWLIKTDSDGNIVWNKTYGGKGMDIGYSVEQTSDGGYIITGGTHIVGSVLWIIKTDNNGNMVWNKTFGGLDWLDVGYCVHQTKDNGFIIAGMTYSYGAGSSDAWLIKTDKDGNKEWDHTFGGGSWDWAQYVEETSDGGFILVGGTDSYSRYGDKDLWLIKTNQYGNKEWGRILGGKDDDRGYCVKEINDGYIVAGSKNLDYYGDWGNAWLLKIVPDNLPPSKPVVSGPSTAKINKPYTVNFSSVDPESDDVYYFVIAWGIGVSGWIGPYHSGETANFTFTCSNEGVYNITVKAIDTHGWESVMPDPLRVTFPKPYWLDLLPPFLQRILSINFFHYTLSFAHE